MDKIYRWELKDIIMVAVLSLFFATAYIGTVRIALIIGSFLTPFGLSQFAIEAVFGVFLTAATITPYIMRKPGVALITETMAAVIQVPMGNPSGVLVIVSGLVQGLGAEAAFAGFRYKRYDMKSMCLAALGACIGSLIWGFFRSGFLLIEPRILFFMFLVRITSSILIAGVLMKVTGDRLAKSGVLKAYPIGRQ